MIHFELLSMYCMRLVSNVIHLYVDIHLSQLKFSFASFKNSFHFYFNSFMSIKQKTLIFCLSCSLINAFKAIISFCLGIWVHPTDFIVIIDNFSSFSIKFFLFILFYSRKVACIINVT